MFVNCTRLKQALRLMKSIAPSRTTFPVLLNVHLEAQDDELTLYCADLGAGLYAKVRIPCKGNLPAVAIECANFNALVATLDHDVELSMDKNLTLTSGKVHSTFAPYHDLDDMPTLPEYGKLAGQVQGNFLKNLSRLAPITHTEFMVTSAIILSKDHALAANGMEGATMIGLLRNTGLDLEATPPANNIVKTTQFFALNDNIDVFASNNAIVFDTERATVISMMLNVPTRDLIPLFNRDYPISIVTSKSELALLFKRASLYSEHYVGLEVKNKMLCLSAVGGTEQHNDEIPVNCSVDDITFPGVNLRDFLNVLPGLGDTITLKLMGEYKAYIITDGVVEYLTAPMRPI